LTLAALAALAALVSPAVLSQAGEVPDVGSSAEGPEAVAEVSSPEVCATAAVEGLGPGPRDVVGA
jgi:hypothetical protein